MVIISSKLDTGARATLSATVEAKVEQDIVAGRYRPGERLDEAELALKLGVSRTPIREALRKLEATGLVVLRPRSGATVSRPSITEIIDLFEVVSELEAFAARLAANRATDTQLAAIHTAYCACEKLATAGNAQAYFDANRILHGTIWAGANNPVLTEQIMVVDKRLAPYRRQVTFHPARNQDSKSEHDLIALALAQHQPDVAQNAMREHVMILSDDALQLARDLRL